MLLEVLQAGRILRLRRGFASLCGGCAQDDNIEMVVAIDLVLTAERANTPVPSEVTPRFAQETLLQRLYEGRN